VTACTQFGIGSASQDVGRIVAGVDTVEVAYGDGLAALALVW
jgi:hypothetical protein